MEPDSVMPTCNRNLLENACPGKENERNETSKDVMIDGRKSDKLCLAD